MTVKGSWAKKNINMRGILDTERIMKNASQVRSLCKRIRRKAFVWVSLMFNVMTAESAPRAIMHESDSCQTKAIK